ncbi:MAG: hypothetical protein CME06_15095, partial [Gemmatimonadetes bacterium]|nr:hypothetical protein [Gemmatimonadota bacterium]
NGAKHRQGTNLRRLATKVGEKCGLALLLAPLPLEPARADAPVDSSAAAGGLEWAVQPLLSWSAEQGVGAGLRVYLIGPPPALSRVQAQAFAAQHDFWSVQLAYRSYRFAGTRVTMRGSLLWEEDGSSRFFGVGNDSALGDQVRFGRNRFAIALEPGRRFGAGWETRLRLKLASEALDFDPDPTRIGGRDFASGETLSSVIAAVLQHDRRDVEWAPTRGSLARLELGRALGPDLSYWRWRAEVRAYHAIFSQLVLAGRVEIDALVGDDLPFYVMPIYGGATYGRGQFAGRFRDLVRRGLAAEIRWDPLPRAGLVAFVDAGEVAPGAFAAAPGPIHTGAGLGLRFTPGPPGLIARLDFGYGGGTEGLHIYLNFGHAF